jgi:hypothetical protein
MVSLKLWLHLLPENMYWMKMREVSTEIGRDGQNTSFSRRGWILGYLSRIESLSCSQDHRLRQTREVYFTQSVTEIGFFSNAVFVLHNTLA